MRDLFAALVIMLFAWLVIGLGVGIFLVVMSVLGWTAAFGALCTTAALGCTLNVVRP